MTSKVEAAPESRHGASTPISRGLGGAEESDQTSAKTEATGWLPAALILGAIVASAAVVVRPNFRGALVDEWAYALPSLHLASGGSLRAASTAIAPDLVPMLLGSATAWLTGGGMWALRLWSLLSLWLGGLAVFGTSRKLGASKSWSLIAAAGLIASPVALPAGTLFMSDAPFAALIAWGTFAAAVWWKDRRPAAALAVGTLAGLSILIRPQGILLALGCAAFALFAGATRRTSAREMSGLLLPSLGAVAALGIWISGEGGATRSMAKYTGEAFLPSIRSALKMLVLLPAYAWLYLALFAAALGLAVLPAAGSTLRAAPGPVRRWLIGALALGPLLAIGLSLSGRHMPYMSWGSLMASNGIGGGDRPEYALLLWVVVTFVVAMAAGGVGLALVAGSPRAEGPSLRASDDRGEASDRERPRPRRVERLLLFLAGLQLIGAAPLGLAFQDGRVGYDRYLLPMAVIALPVVVARVARIDSPRIVAICVVGVVWIGSLVGMQDWIAQREVAWSTLEGMVASGIPIDQIDGGFEWDSMNLSEAPPRPAAGGPVSWQVNEFAPAIDPVWVVARDQLDGYEVVRRVEWRGWLRGGELLVMKRRP